VNEFAVEAEHRTHAGLAQANRVCEDRLKYWPDIGRRDADDAQVSLDAACCSRASLSSRVSRAVSSNLSSSSLLRKSSSLRNSATDGPRRRAGDPVTLRRPRFSVFARFTTSPQNDFFFEMLGLPDSL
jgi:hypothetical protein